MQRRIADRFELRLAVKLRRRHLHRALLDRRGLRDGRGNGRLLCLWRAGYRGLDVLFGAVVRNIGKVGRQFVCRDKGPWPAHVAGAEPAPGDQYITVLIADFLEDVPGGVAHVQQAGALNRLPLRGAVGDQQFRWRGGDEDLWLRRLGQAGNLVLRIALSGEQIHLATLYRRLFGFFQFGRRCSEARVVAVHLIRDHPAVEYVQVVFALDVLEQQWARVDHPLQLGAFHRPVSRFAVDVHEDCRAVGADDGRRCVFQGRAVGFLFSVEHANRCFQLIQ